MNNANKKILGSGLDALFEASTKKYSHAVDEFQSLKITQLVPGKYQPRSKINAETIKELSDSIKSQGIIQPLIIRKIGAEKYEIIAGERRWQAAQMAGFSHVPVIIKKITDETALAFSLIENIQRENLNPIEEALAIKRLIDEFSMTQEKVAEKVGKQRSSVTNLLGLLNLSENVQDLIKARKIEFGHAKLLKTLNEEQQIHVANVVAEKQLSVRDTEKLIEKMKAQPQATINEIVHADQGLQRKMKRWDEEFSTRLSTEVKVSLNKNEEGKVVIKVRSAKEVDWLLNHFEVLKEKA